VPVTGVRLSRFAGVANHTEFPPHLVCCALNEIAVVCGVVVAIWSLGRSWKQTVLHCDYAQDDRRHPAELDCMG
jgi:hypothetical protein